MPPGSKVARGHASLPPRQTQDSPSGPALAPKKEPYNPALGAPPSLNHRHGVVMNELHGLARFKASAQATFSRLIPSSSRVAPSPAPAASATSVASTSTSGSRAAAAAPLSSTARARVAEGSADRKATQAPVGGLMARMVARLKRSDAPALPAALKSTTLPAATVGPASSGTVVRRDADERAPAFLHDATAHRKAAPDASPPAAAPQQPATLSALVFEGDDHRVQTVYVASRTQAPSRLSCNFLGLDPDLKFDDLYGHEEFHGVVVDELLTVRRLARRDGRTLREHLSDDANLKGRPPTQGRRIRAQLLNIRNGTHARLNRVLALFAKRLHKEADLAQGGINKEVADLVAFSNDLQYGRVKQLIAGTPEFERFKAMEVQGRRGRPG